MTTEKITKSMHRVKEIRITSIVVVETPRLAPPYSKTKTLLLELEVRTLYN